MSVEALEDSQSEDELGEVHINLSRFLTTAKVKVRKVNISIHTRVVEIEDSEDENKSSFETQIG